MGYRPYEWTTVRQLNRSRLHFYPFCIQHKFISVGTQTWTKCKVQCGLWIMNKSMEWKTYRFKSKNNNLFMNYVFDKLCVCARERECERQRAKLTTTEWRRLLFDDDELNKWPNQYNWRLFHPPSSRSYERNTNAHLSNRSTWKSVSPWPCSQPWPYMSSILCSRVFLVSVNLESGMCMRQTDFENWLNCANLRKTNDPRNASTHTLDGMGKYFIIYRTFDFPCALRVAFLRNRNSLAKQVNIPFRLHRVTPTFLLGSIA